MVNLFFYSEFNVRMLIIKKKNKNLMNLVHCQKQLKCHQHILNKFVKVIFTKPLRFVKTHEDVSKGRS